MIYENVNTDLYQILDEQGQADESKLSGLEMNRDLLFQMYQGILKGRLLDQRMLTLQRQGRISTYGSIQGQEAAQVGSALALDPQDWIAPTYREIAVLLTHGLDIKFLLMYMKGYFGGNRFPTNLNILPIQIMIASQIPHAVGCAWASKLKGEKQVTVCYFGDGATSEGDFHEALNFAAVFNLPVVFFCQNNQWAISVPYHKQTASRTIVQKAVAYGMRGVRVDGNDVLACYQVTKEAVNRARLGQGPTLIEALTYRLGSHTTADDWTKYRKEEEVEQWRKKDPLVRLERFLKERQLLTDEIKENLLNRFREEIEQAVQDFEALPPPKAYEIFDYVYDKPHVLLMKQKEELQNRLERGRGNGSINDD